MSKEARNRSVGRTKASREASSLVENGKQKKKGEDEKSDAGAEAAVAGFVELGVDAGIAANMCSRLDLGAPTPVQRAALGALLKPSNAEGKNADVLLRAETGSGKTLAFLLPVLQRLMLAQTCGEAVPALEGTPGAQKPADRSLGPLVLVLSPTRELADQLTRVATAVCNMPPSAERRHWLVVGCLVGGEKRKSEKARIRKGINVLVSCPGRLLDHLGSTSALDVSNLQYVVLDEADRLLDLGFEAPLRRIFKCLVNNNQDDSSEESNATKVRSFRTILCSATLDTGSAFASFALRKNPIVVDTRNSNNDLDQSNPAGLMHQVLAVTRKLKLAALVDLLNRVYLESTQKSASNNTSAADVAKVIVFAATRASVEFLEKIIPIMLTSSKTSYSGDEAKKDVSVVALHGSLDAAQRRTRMAEFTSNRGGKKTKTGSSFVVLITTDVAARGLDLDHVDHVVQYDPPTDLSDFAHRAGRTARAGRKGTATLVLVDHEIEFKDTLAKAHGIKFVDSAFGSRKSKNESFDRALERRLGLISQRAKNAVAGDPKIKELAAVAFDSYVKSYATFPKPVKHIFSVRTLHQGHLAESFGLSDAPKDVRSSNASANASAPEKRAGKSSAAVPAQDSEFQMFEFDGPSDAPSKAGKRSRQSLPNAGRALKAGSALKRRKLG